MKDQTDPASTEAPAHPLHELVFAAAVEFHRTEQLEKAEALYRAVLALHETHANASYNLGLIYHRQRRLPEAVIAYRNAIFFRIDYADAYGNLGTVMKEQGKQAEALIFYRQAMAYDPTNAMCYSNLGVLLNEMGKSEEALAAFRHAMLYKPDYEWTYINMASTLLNLGHFQASAEVSRRGAALDPKAPIAQFNIGASLKTLNQIDGAIAALQQAVALDPNFGEAHFALGQVLLMQGRFEEGWPEYEWRWKLPEYSWLRDIHGEFQQPQWRGESLTGKTILIYAEQGLGDAIQYARYIPMVLKTGAHVVLAVHPPLKPLFTGVEGVTIVGLDEKLPDDFDFHCPLLGLPQVFKTSFASIPAEIPYLRVDMAKKKRWAERVGGDGLKVGVIWAGNPTQRGDRWRSPRLAAFQRLFKVPGVKFFALQMGAGRNDMMEFPLPPDVVDLGKEISDFSDTAAIMAGLDLVITSCTAPLHLAGALGVPTWATIPFAPHFLWQLDRPDSPWYPTLRLYRQDKAGTDWSSLMDRVAADLAKLAAR